MTCLGLLLSSCATTGTTPTKEVDAVTKTLLISETFGRFQDAVALSTDQFGNTYIVDRGAPAIIKYGPRGDSLGVISGFGRDQYQFDAPSDVDARLTNAILIADHNNHRVERYTRDFAYAASLERRRDDQEQLGFGYPTQVAADDAGNIYFIDGENKRVMKANSSMRLERVLGSHTIANLPGGSLFNPTELAVDGNGNVIVYDPGRAHLVVFDPLGSAVKTRMIAGGEEAMEIVALACRNDTLFALTNSLSGVLLRLFHSPSLVSLGYWQILGREEPMSAIDLDVRNGVTLLTKNAVMRANMSMVIDEIK